MREINQVLNYRISATTIPNVIYMQYLYRCTCMYVFLCKATCVCVCVRAVCVCTVCVHVCVCVQLLGTGSSKPLRKLPGWTQWHHVCWNYVLSVPSA